MGWFNNLPIGRKLMLGFGALVVALLVTTFMAYRIQAAMLATTEGIVNADVRRVQLSYDAEVDLLLMTRNVRDIMLSSATERGQKLEKGEDLARRVTASLQATTDSMLRKDVAQSMLAAWQEYRRVYQGEFVPLVRAGRIEEARSVTTNGLLVQATALGDKLQNVVTFNKQLMAKKVADAATEGHRAMILLLTIFLFSSAISLTIASLILRTISASLGQLVSGVSRVADGDLTVTLNAMSRDELGRLSVDFARMTDSLRELVVRISATATDVAAASQQMSAATDEAARATQQVSLTVSQLAEGSSQQAEAVTSGARDTQEMNEAAGRVSGSAAQAAQAAAGMEHAAGSGQDALATAVSRMEGLHRTVTQSASTVRELGDLSDQIGQIVGIIKGIAAQTNLLALNAAIEAARAGDHGRGFAVVADEVRKLAAESATSAQQITTMIEQVQQETRRAVEAMERGQSEADDAMRMIGQANNSIGDIAGAVSMTTQEVAAISAEIAALASGLRRVAGGMEDISAVAEENAASAEEVSAAAEEQTASIEEISASAQSLSSMAEDLQGMVGRFKVSDGGDSSFRPRTAQALSASRQLMASR